LKAPEASNELSGDAKDPGKFGKPGLGAWRRSTWPTTSSTTARLQHPHILPLLDGGTADGFLYYVMPYVAGETLRSRLERERQRRPFRVIHVLAILP
jgi:serine/threonine protein kinase